MKVRNITVSVEEYEKDERLPEDEERLIRSASEATAQSYAPYSEFQVGAALRLANGEIIMGSNQENAAYPSGLCAERVALFYAKSTYPDAVIEAIAITAKANDFEVGYPISPCGACRQVMAETEARQGKKIRIIMRGHSGKTNVADGIENLLPFIFKEEKLKRSKTKKI